MDWQQWCAALRGRLVITGGPGTGKTYTAARLLALLLAMHPSPDTQRVALAAPTGKAAARLRQGHRPVAARLAGPPGDALDLAAFTQRMGQAKTVHALLGARPDTRQFKHHRTHPLDLDVIVDETSMVNLELMAALLQALPPPPPGWWCRGDKDQLASVEAGAGDPVRPGRAATLPPRHPGLPATHLRPAPAICPSGQPACCGDADAAAGAVVRTPLVITLTGADPCPRWRSRL